MVDAKPLKHRHSHLQSPPSPGSLREVPSASSDGLASQQVTQIKRTASRGSSKQGGNVIPTFCVILISVISLAVALGLVFALFTKYRVVLEARLHEHWNSAELLPLKQTMEDAMDVLRKERNDLEQKFKVQSSLAEKLQKDLINLHQGTTTDPATLSKMSKENERLHKYKTRMHYAIQLLSSRLLLDHFGPGPHRVNVTVGFDPQSNVASDKQYDSFIIEMAPEDLMPHTVYWFLSQVDQGLWNGCSFHRNAGHVVQSGTATNFLTPPGEGAKLIHRFKETKLESVLFQEYSAQFPHVKYTMGYAGRPGGPDFYVSTEDNTANHGPGGQGSYEDPTEADPCFAKVVEGFDVVDRIHKSAVQEGRYKSMQHNVAIVKMERVIQK